MSTVNIYLKMLDHSSYIHNQYYFWMVELVLDQLERDPSISIAGECHHLLPDSILSNNVTLLVPYQVHFVIHELFTEFTTGEDKIKMQRAIWEMCIRPDGQFITTPEEYEYHRKNFIESMSGEKNPFYGRKHTVDTKKQMSMSHSKVNHSEISKSLWADPEYRSKMEAILFSADAIENRRQKTTALWSDPKWRENQLKILSSPEQSKKLSEAGKEAWKDPVKADNMMANRDYEQISKSVNKHYANRTEEEKEQHAIKSVPKSRLKTSWPIDFYGQHFYSWAALQAATKVTRHLYLHHYPQRDPRLFVGLDGGQAAALLAKLDPTYQSKTQKVIEYNGGTFRTWEELKEATGLTKSMMKYYPDIDPIALVGIKGGRQIKARLKELGYPMDKLE